MSTSGQRPSSSSRDLTLVVESESGAPEEYFAQVGISIGRATSNTIHIDHPDLDHIHAKVVKWEESFLLRCEGQAKLQVLDPEPREVGEVELIPGLTIELGGVTIRCRQQIKGMGSLNDDYWAEAAGGERFPVASETFTGDLPKKVGPYEIRKFVARGGMGIVLYGIHETTGQPAAVKLPSSDLSKDHKWLRRFWEEVRTLKSVSHPNLVRLLDSGQEGGMHWMAMDWVEGFTVKDWLAEWDKSQLKVPLDQIAEFMSQMVDGLSYLHLHGVVHRDLKPSNLLVDQDSIVKVADFGLAKQVGGEQSTFLTRTGTIAGTMHYMAPEQAEGEEVTRATDIYALGVIWHELLTGKRPGRRLKLDEQRSDCPQGWGDQIEQCLDDEPHDRPELESIKHTLDAWELNTAPTPAAPYATAAPKPSRDQLKKTASFKLSPTIFFALFCLIAVAVFVVGKSILEYRDQKTERNVEQAAEKAAWQAAEDAAWYAAVEKREAAENRLEVAAAEKAAAMTNARIQLESKMQTRLSEMIRSYTGMTGEKLIEAKGRPDYARRVDESGGTAIDPSTGLPKVTRIDMPKGGGIWIYSEIFPVSDPKTDVNGNVWDGLKVEYEFQISQNRVRGVAKTIRRELISSMGE